MTRSSRMNSAMPSQLIDRFGRCVNYLRLSVTDRCDFRCVYCMAEKMEFLPRNEVLSLEELYAVAAAFSRLGVRKIRLTGGEPLVRRDILTLIERLGRLPGELVLTTNGSQLPRMAEDLARAGVSRLNISLDSLQPERFRELTRTGRLEQVLAGIEAARSAGFRRIKLNTVVLKGRNEDEVLDLVEFARQGGLDISFIEEMPLGIIGEHDREETFCSSDELRELIGSRYPLLKSAESTGGPRNTIAWPTRPPVSASSLRTVTTSAASATVCGLPWRGVCCFVWAMSTRWICGRRCGAIRVTAPGWNSCSSRRWRSSRKSMSFASTKRLRSSVS